MDARGVRQRRLSRHGLFCWLVVALLARGASAATSSFDYLYVEANSGSSAGGHAAVRFDDDVHHFQHAAPGIIRPVVQSWTSFDHAYRGLENRPIHVLRVAVPQETFDRLRSEFRRRHVTQESHVRLFEALGRERELLACLVASETKRLTECEVHLPGAGYFYPSRRDALASSSISPSIVATATSALKGVALDVSNRYGSGFLEHRMREVESRIMDLRPEAAVLDRIQPGAFAASLRSYGDRYRDLLLELLALRVLTGQATPNAHAFRMVAPRLSPSQLTRLAQRAAWTRETIVTLLRSPRTDRGYPLLVALARLVAFRMSLGHRMLIVLDTYADATPVVRLAPVQSLPALDALREERGKEMQEAFRFALTGPPGDEAAWSRFEVAANVALELNEAIAESRPLRAHQRTLSPARGATPRQDWPVPAPSHAAATAALERVTRQHRQVEQRLIELYRYDLLQRNCVTEIFRTIDDSGVALAGRIDVAGTANFIPFVSAAAVEESYPVAQRFVLPSHRQQQLDHMREQGADWRMMLREGTSLTSTVVPYEASEEAFLFFSSGAPLLRPLLGAANVTFASAAILAGTLAAPFDRGSLLAAGARGVFYSLPEIAFVNIRKGTVPLLPSSWDVASSAGHDTDGTGISSWPQP